jgi:hypothetical protein
VYVKIVQFVGQDVGVRGGLQDLCDVFQADGGVGVLFCRKVEGRTRRKLEVLDDGIGTDGVEDVSEGLGGEGGDGEVDGGCEEGEEEGGRRGVVAGQGIGWRGGARKGRGEGMACAGNEGGGHVERGAAAVQACDGYPRERVRWAEERGDTRTRTLRGAVR